MNEILVHQNNELAKINIEEAYTRQLTEQTKRSYVQTIKEFFGKNNINDITVEEMQAVTPDMVNQYAHNLLYNGLSKATINKKLSALHNFYKFLCRRMVGVCAYNPFSTDEGAIRFKHTTKTYSDKRALSPEEVHLLFQSAKDTEGIVGTRDLLILMLLATTGARRAELCGIKIGDIHTNNGKKIIEILGKGNKTRIIVLSKGVEELIDKYLVARGLTYKDKEMPLITSHSHRSEPNEFITTNTIYRAVKTHADRAGIDADTISPHNLRHTFATVSYKELGISKDSLQELMGHSSSATTQRYIAASNMINDTDG